MISQLMGSSPALGSVLTAQSLEPASDSLSLCPFKMNKYQKKIFLKAISMQNVTICNLIRVINSFLNWFLLLYHVEKSLPHLETIEVSCFLGMLLWL